jgi:hypothetical protein
VNPSRDFGFAKKRWARRSRLDWKIDGPRLGGKRLCGSRRRRSMIKQTTFSLTWHQKKMFLSMSRTKTSVCRPLDCFSCYG